jgi:hypothetical protein
LPVPLVSLPEVAETNTPNESLRMHGSVVRLGTSLLLKQSPEHLW